jgi:hypothetical protein
MQLQALTRLAAAVIFGLSCAVAVRAQSAAPSPAASNPAAALPLWAQQKLAESRGDPQVFERYFKILSKAAKALTDDDIKALVAYMGSMK